MSEAIVQWKGTDVCLDFHCDCGNSTHFDGYSAYSIECGICGARYTMDMTLNLLPYNGSIEPVVTIP